MLLETTAANFEKDVLQSEVPVLVDVWAPWCGPCKMISPLLDEIAATETSFNIVKINADENPSLVKDLGIRGVPWLGFYRNGALVESKNGAMSKKQILEFVMPHLMVYPPSTTHSLVNIVE